MLLPKDAVLLMRSVDIALYVPDCLPLSRAAGYSLITTLLAYGGCCVTLCSAGPAHCQGSHSCARTTRVLL
jgi:hypothetical protein